jgi:HAMP domain-containing protein
LDALMNVDPVVVALGAAVAALLAWVATMMVLARQRKLLRRYRQLLNGTADHNLEQLLLAQGETLDQVQAELASLGRKLAELERQSRLHVQKVGIVRFNAFPDTGSDLSFSIALLDANNDGIVLTSLYGRSESRTYAKPIKNGKSTYQLSEEEIAAIAKATGVAEN